MSYCVYYKVSHSCSEPWVPSPVPGRPRCCGNPVKRHPNVISDPSLNSPSPVTRWPANKWLRGDTMSRLLPEAQPLVRFREKTYRYIFSTFIHCKLLNQHSSNRAIKMIRQRKWKTDCHNLLTSRPQPDSSVLLEVHKFSNALFGVLDLDTDISLGWSYWLEVFEWHWPYYAP